MIELQLHENWQLCDIKKQDWIPAQVPGDIYSALLKAEKMPDPFFGDNEYQAKALMEEDYEYRTVFTYDFRLENWYRKVRMHLGISSDHR